jgi:hypothetical protein
MATALFVAHLAVTLFMTGVIWFVQIVHYPLFRCVGNSEFARYEAAHIFWISDGILWLNLALLSAIWLSTAFLQGPCHQRLRQGFDAATHHRLVVTNWLRTVCWTVRSGLLLWLAAKLVRV